MIELPARGPAPTPPRRRRPATPSRVTPSRRARRSCVGARRRSARGCAIQPDAGPADIPADERGPLDPVDARRRRGTAGSSRVFLVADATATASSRCARSRAASTADPAAPCSTSCSTGPTTQELGARARHRAARRACALISAPLGRPARCTSTCHRRSSTCPAPTLRLRRRPDRVHGQRARRASARCASRVDGEPRAWPDGRGELQTEPLTVLRLPRPRRVGAAARTPPIPSEQRHLTAAVSDPPTAACQAKKTSATS